MVIHVIFHRAVDMISTRSSEQTSGLFLRVLALVLMIATPVLAQPNDPRGDVRDPGDPQQSWNRWGGPDSNFTVEGVSLADEWPDNGPRLLWNKPLGEGYSSVVTSDGQLFTMFREDDSEVIVALNATSGETLWEHRYEASYSSAMRQYGPGPHSTPLVTGKTVIAIGINLVIHALDIETGKVVWKHDLVKEYGAKVPFRGYAPSPVVCGDSVIFATDMPPVTEANKVQTAVGNHALASFRISDGKLLWTGMEGVTAYSSPVVVEMAGVQQVVLLMRKFVAAADPNNGKELWRHPVSEAHNVATPLCREDAVFVTAAYDSGGKIVSITKDEESGKLAASERWFSRKIRFDQGNAIWIGNYLFATTGDSGPAFLTCVDARTGEQVWRERGFRRATMVHADKKVILLQEDGTLQLLQLSPDGPTILASHKIEIERKPAWTPPTLIGSTLFIRNRTHLMAFELASEDP